MTPAVVLFDLGNVLVTIHPEAFIHDLGIPVEAARRRIRTPLVSMITQYESGKISTDGYLLELGKLFGGRYSRDQLKAAMLKIIGVPVEGMDELVHHVATRARPGLVSNTNELHFTYCRERIPVLQAITEYFLSYEVGAVKPEPEYYAKVLRKLSVEPAQILFIDDTAVNVEGARKAGMMAIHFVSPAHLKGELMTLGFTF